MRGTVPGFPDDLTIDPLTGMVTTPADVRATPARASTTFVPGAIVAGRYRLVSLLGRGGMGEVYRADDLTLDQPVALKFLPAVAAADDRRLAQFHNELRTARQVSHKNVCRLYDLGQADGRPFLTMEYVDGEDLASSLRRFGRMPPDKALQIARQLCAGVAAAHDKGVLHRDLKPANVMLDGNGDVRVTDFGIATAVADAGGEIAGTPQYLAPEVLAGRPASVKSDIYALGLILFEVFTGRRAFEAKTIGELRDLHRSHAMTTPSAIVADLDPAVERVILRCTDPDPDRRPAAALAVAAALPGADPLAAALAAGETPSPELLVAAGATEAMSVARALTLFAAFVVLLLVSVAIVSRGSVIGQVPAPLPPDALSDRATQILAKLGYANDAADRARGLTQAFDYMRWEQQRDPIGWWQRLAAGRPAALLFWMRTSPREMLPSGAANAVSIADPPMNVSGMHQVWLDTEGRLVEFHSVPPQVTTNGEPPAAAAPWPAMFDAAQLDPASFMPATPTWLPRDFADATAAWEAPMPGRPDQRVRIEAASFRNRLVSFQIIWPWTVPTRQQQATVRTAQRVAAFANVSIYLVILAGAGIVARHNVKANRADRRGAVRLAVVILLGAFASSLLTETHVGNPPFELNGQILGPLAFALRTACIVWVLYLAVEPYARRFWPDSLLGWSRLLSGHLRDPRVGRELLVGLAIGASGLLASTVRLAPMAFGGRLATLPFGTALPPLVAAGPLVARWLNEISQGLQGALAVTAVYVLARLVLRRTGLSLVVGATVLAILVNGGAVITGDWAAKYDTMLFVGLTLFTLNRIGLVATATTLLTANVVQNIPMTTQVSAWWSGPTLLTVTLLIALGMFAYLAARAGQPLFGAMLEENA